MGTRDNNQRLALIRFQIPCPLFVKLLSGLPQINKISLVEIIQSHG
uniref:Uncharacterized protein n=1 Tax=Curvibacter symbiont subsp. Hydra magnipapillata TaxID=667019 RepID=C9YBL6_CURXX|nr:hypothetical protein Csp_A15170 [Curvibacter putative symbiont of Hydra magnipapillata]